MSDFASAETPQQGDLYATLLGLYRRNNNSLRPVDVVEAARPISSPLHTYFDWDDANAAEKYRLDQARGLIRRVKVRFIDSDEEMEKVPAFVSVVRPTGPSYVPTEEVREDPFQSKLVLARAERDWRNLLSRYKHLQGFINVVRRDVDDIAG